MKKFVFLIVLPLSFLACSNDEDVPKENQEQEVPITVENLIGKWQLVASGGTDFDFTPIPENLQYFYKFQENGTVTTDRYDEYDENCVSGMYELNNNYISFDFDCSNFTVPIERLYQSELILRYLADDATILFKFKRMNVQN